jgi:hypothetical protein
MNIISSAVSLIQPQVGHELLEKYGPLLRTGIDKAFQRVGRFPVQGEKYFMSSTEKKGYKKYQGKVGVGTLKQNRDNAPLPKLEGALGFEHEISTVGYRGAMSVERELLEKELYGQIGKEQRELVDAGKRTIEMILADVFNRGHGGITYATAASGNGLAQFICEDGMYFISKSRNNPIAAAGTWSNRLPDVAFTAAGNNDALVGDLIRDAKLAFRQYRNDRGILSPLTLKRVICSPVMEDTMMRVTGTKMVYSGTGIYGALGPDNTTDPVTSVSAESKFSDNAINTIAGTPFEVYDWLDDGLVYFEAMGENELELLWRVKPNVMTYTDGNPDMLHQRIRMSLGAGCPRPVTWMGALCTGTENLS